MLAAGDPRDIPALLSRQLVEPVGGPKMQEPCVLMSCRYLPLALIHTSGPQLGALHRHLPARSPMLPSSVVS